MLFCIKYQEYSLNLLGISQLFDGAVNIVCSLIEGIQDNLILNSVVTVYCLQSLILVVFRIVRYYSFCKIIFISHSAGNKSLETCMFPFNQG